MMRGFDERASGVWGGLVEKASRAGAVSGGGVGLVGEGGGADVVGGGCDPCGGRVE